MKLALIPIGVDWLNDIGVLCLLPNSPIGLVSTLVQEVAYGKVATLHTRTVSLRLTWFSSGAKSGFGNFRNGSVSGSIENSSSVNFHIQNANDIVLKSPFNALKVDGFLKFPFSRLWPFSATFTRVEYFFTGTGHISKTDLTITVGITRIWYTIQN